MSEVKKLSTEELESGLDHILQSPKSEGTLDMIVRRPAENEREVLDEGELNAEVGLVGDTWINRGSSRSADGKAHPDMQLNIMNSRVVDLVAGSQERWPLAGDQLYVDLDLSEANLPPGSQLSLGEAVIEVTNQPHTGCNKFTERYGLEANRFVNSKRGRELHLRGLNAKVIQAGKIRAGDMVKKL